MYIGTHICGMGTCILYVLVCGMEYGCICILVLIYVEWVCVHICTGIYMYVEWNVGVYVLRNGVSLYVFIGVCTHVCMDVHV